jgi:hypothetical protein
VWLQFALLGVALFAIVKGILVFGVALAVSWMTTAALRAIPFGAWIIGEAAGTQSPRATIGGLRRVGQ